MAAEVSNPFVALTFIVGPAILTNACAILQNSATMRYGLAIPQWREFRASIAVGDGALEQLYSNPQAASAAAEKRIRLLLRGLNLLYTAVAVFALASLLGLTGAVLATEGHPEVSVWLVVSCGGAGLVLMFAAMSMFVSESRCARDMLELQLDMPGGE
ncbi:DUF2721 domain-containing protein [Phenylobacterium koreense]|uniref:DUF2721 domain-containing protein n=1 Tax=Phenylobacterium koreense TaxID=266125 RepID=A0ABV2ENB9_9CAUL